MFEMTPFERTYHNLFSRNPFADFEKEFFQHNMQTLTDFQTDVQDQGDAFLLEADLPGFDKKDIQIEVHNHRLTIKAQRHQSHDDKDAKGNYLRRERSYGSFTRSFDIDAIEEDLISASYNDGVLKLTLPKKKETASASHQIDIQ